MTIIAIDYGEKNLGLAVGDSELGATKTLEVVRKDRAHNYMQKIVKIVNEWEAKRIVVGSPLNSVGEETAKSKQVNSFIKKLRQSFRNTPGAEQIEFITEDEFLSTQLSNMGLNPKRKRTQGDSYAAEYILQSYLARTAE